MHSMCVSCAHLMDMSYWNQLHTDSRVSLREPPFQSPSSAVSIGVDLISYQFVVSCTYLTPIVWCGSKRIPGRGSTWMELSLHHTVCVCVCVSCKRGDWKNVGVYTGSDVIPDPTPSFQDYGNSLNSTKYYLPTVGVGDFNVTQNS